MAEDTHFGFARPLLPAIGEIRTTGSHTVSPNSILVHAPGGTLDLSLYNYQPIPTKGNESTAREENFGSVEDELEADQPPPKKKIFKGPRRSSILERFVALLEDRRIMESSEDARQLEDIKMPRLRNVLNIIFITSGVCFLLAVVVVILYTTFASNTPPST
uniref:Uncharacterized protein n=1 Tax=Mesocestoides corti TaxID=53468 RepID=A0A5K3F8W9_MESCO